MNFIPLYFPDKLAIVNPAGTIGVPSGRGQSDPEMPLAGHFWDREWHLRRNDAVANQGKPRLGTH